MLLQAGAKPQVGDVPALWCAALFVRVIVPAVCVCVCVHIAIGLIAMQGSVEIVDMLLQHGADVNQKSPRGTPLQGALTACLCCL